MKKLIKYTTVGVAIVLICFVTAWVQATFTTYSNVNWFKPAGRAVHFAKYSFAKYQVPDTYKLITFRHDERYRHGLLLYENKITGQLFVLLVLKGFSKVDLAELETDKAKPKRPLWKAIRYPLGYENHPFSILHYMPFGWRDDYEDADNDLTIKGVQVNSENEIDTNIAKIKWIAGDFEILEFKKQSHTWRPFISTALDFSKPMNGTIAVMNEKATGSTIFAIGANDGKESFNEDEFRKIVDSIRFDTVSSDEYQMEFRTYREKMQKELSGPELDKALAEYVNAH